MSSKSSVVNTNDSHDDNSVQQGEYAATRGDGNTTTVSILDGGAIKDALKLAASALDTNRGVITDTEKQFGEYVKSVNNSAASVLQDVTAANKESLAGVRQAFQTSTGAIDGQTLIGWLIGGALAVMLGVGVFFGGNHVKK